MTTKAEYLRKITLQILSSSEEDGQNIVNDLHWKCAHFLCANFETIIIPKFETKKMTKKVNRNIKGVYNNCPR